MAEKIEKQILGLAGEFGVASELCRRNIYAQLTLGNRKRVDLIIDDGNAMLRIEVKAKQGNEWPGVGGPRNKKTIIVFVDFSKKDPTERPDYYILDLQAWKKVLQKELVQPGFVKRGKVKIDKEGGVEWSDGYKGLGVKPSMISRYLEKWERIQRMLG